MKKQLLSFCSYYKGEEENPFKIPEKFDLMTELRHHYWEYESIFVNRYEDALFAFTQANKRNGVDPGEFTEEDVFKNWVKEFTEKCTPSEYDSYKTYFSDELIAR